MAKTMLSDAVKEAVNQKANLSAEVIKKGVTAFGITGTFTNDATAGSKNIHYDKTAYVSGNLLSGSAHNATTSIPIETTFVNNITISKPDSGNYTFTLTDDGYYTSNNKGVHSSYALGKLSFDVLIDSVDITLDCIDYAESNYDFGILSNLDTTLTSSTTADTTNVMKSFKGASSTSVQQVTYSGIAKGTHFIYLKYRKDSSSSAGNDNFKVKVNGAVDGKIEGIGYKDVSALPFVSTSDMYAYSHAENNMKAVIIDTDLKITDLYNYTNSSWKKQNVILEDEYATDLELAKDIYGDNIETYTELNYIESTGTQWIDTEYKIDSNSTVEIKMKDESSDLYSVFSGDSSSVFQLQKDADDSTLYVKWGANGKYVSIGSMEEVHTYKYKDDTLYIDDTSMTTFSSGEFTSANNLILFALSSTGGAAANMKLYSFKIYNGDTLVRDFIPVLRTSDSAICLYDKANSTYYLNAGTGVFTSGGVK